MDAPDSRQDTRRFQWRVFFAVAASLTAILGVVWSFIPPFYDTNDDVLIRQLIEGHLAPGQPPTGYLLFVHSGLGWALVALQHLVPAVPWWDVTLVVLLLWSFSVIFALGWNAFGSSFSARSVAMLVLASAVLSIAFSLQFTISATLAGGIAVILAFAEFQTETPRPRVSVLATSGALLLAGELVRPIGAPAGALMMIGLLIPLAIAVDTRVHLRLLASFFVVTVLTSALVNYSDGELYRFGGPDWTHYYEYHSKIVGMLDWAGGPSSGDIDKVRAAAGWTVNDWGLLRGSWGVDPLLHGLDRVARAYDAHLAVMSTETPIERLLGPVGSADLPAFRQLVATVLVFIAPATVLGLALATRRALVTTAAVIITFCVICFAIQVAVKDLPFRLLAPLEVCLTTTLVVTMGALGRGTPRRAAFLGIALLVVLISLEGRVMARQALAEDNQSRGIAVQVSELLLLRPSLLVFHSDAFPSENWWRPFRRPSITLSAVQLGLDDQSPLLQRFLASTGRQPLLRTLCTDPSILVVTERGRLDTVTTYWKEHLGRDVTWTQVYSGSFRVWRCHLAP